MAYLSSSSLPAQVSFQMKNNKDSNPYWWKRCLSEQVTKGQGLAIIQSDVTISSSKYVLISTSALRYTFKAPSCMNTKSRLFKS